MRLEVTSVANFLVHLIGQKLKPKEQERFAKCLIQFLCYKYRDHWLPAKPYFGCGYRCLRFREDYFDPKIEQACHLANVSKSTVKKALPPNMMVWIDPFEVTYRIGDNGCICSIYEFGDDKINVPWQCPPSLPTPMSKWYCCWKK